MSQRLVPSVTFLNESTRYDAIINSWISLQPDLIYIQFKGGNLNSTYQNAFLLGLRCTLHFDQG
jgi:carbohydrate-selective porin OprB